MISYKSPGGPLAGKPVQDYNGTWRNQFGEKIHFSSRDAKYSDGFWSHQPKGMRETIISNILDATKKGVLAIQVNPKGLTESDKERLSAYRVLARQMGYNVYGFDFNETSYAAIATVKRVCS